MLSGHSSSSGDQHPVEDFAEQRTLDAFLGCRLACDPAVRLAGWRCAGGGMLRGGASAGASAAPRTRLSLAAGIAEFFQAIAEAAHGGDAHAADLDFLAQPVHIHFDRVVADFLAPFAQVVDQLFFRDQAAGSAAAGLPAGPVRAPTGPASGRRCRRCGRPGRSTAGRAGSRSGRRRRRAASAPAPAPPVPTARTAWPCSRRRRGRAPFTRCSIESAAVRISTGKRELRARRRRSTSSPDSLRQAQVEDQQIEILGGQRRVGFGAILDAVGRIAGVAQRARQAVGQYTVIFGKQYSHGGRGERESEGSLLRFAIPTR